MERQVYNRLDALQDEHWWFRSRREILSSILSRVQLPSLTPAILEAGCGTGGNLGMLSKFGKVTAFEHDTGALEKARAKSVCEIEQGTLPQATPQYSNPFDLVVAFDVIEHVKEDIESLKKLRSELKPNGKMVLTVPAFSFLWSKHDDIHHHFRRYTRPQLNRVLQEAGYKVEYISYFNSLLFPVVVAMRFAKNLFGMEEAPDDNMPARGLNRILHTIFSSERFWLGKVSVPFGVSLIAIAQNPATPT